MADAASAWLVDQIRTGGESAWEQLIEAYEGRLSAFVRARLRDPHTVDDVVQETFLRAYRQIEKFEERANFGTWLHRIAVNCSLDLLRARGRHEKHRMTSKDDEDGEMTREFESTDPQPDRLLLSAELKQHVLAALERLSGNERTAFMLRHFEGMPVEEIGRTLGIQMSAAKHTIFRAVRKLRESLEPLVRKTPCNI